MCRLVSLSPCPPLANAITVELYRNASIYCEMAVIDFRLCCARVCVCVCIDVIRYFCACIGEIIFSHDSIYSFNSRSSWPFFLCIWHFTVLCVQIVIKMCINCASMCACERGGEGSFANCRVRVQYLPALNRRCINIMCQHKKHSGHAQTQRWHTYTHTQTNRHIHTHTHTYSRNTCKHRLKSFLSLALPWRTVQWSELEMSLAWNMISYMNR